MTNYQKPRVWEWQDVNNERTGNRPTAGARFEQSLPRGKHDLQVYSLATPNGIKVPIMLEELLAIGKAAEYDLYKINIGQGDQFGSAFVELNPNSKIPVLVDYSQGEPGLNVFESGSILVYLADKFASFIPQDFSQRTQCLNWVFWQVGGAPFVGGGFGHFFHYAPEALEYPINRYAMETKRQLDVLDQHLADKAYVCGENYTIADMMIWPWMGQLVDGKLYPGSDVFLDVQAYPHVKAWSQRISQRPAVQKALKADYQPITK
ncbi:glutathione-dependent disulfide-bond oxidoreductase [Vaginisenegalia massiliensis]|uniref:glutathione-dependent disulfide-bond oxidoreductase n=1 Tax=Vaginisenegalia massiliensis TaxID=2058294 RepID=UPI000F51E4C0|nr:glutathione-dependent disulfide-bond oxidoreductase [Vaginisenegalia massiliensis]